MKQAAVYAAFCHAGKMRKDGRTPYIFHPVTVFNILRREGGVADRVVLTASLLHDVIEDTPVTRGMIGAVFGNSVADLVAEVTDDKALSSAEAKAAQLAKDWSRPAALIKMADKTANLRDIIERPPAWPAARKRAYATHAAALVAKIAHHNAGLAKAFERAHDDVMMITGD